jgi:hypothetical protein
MASSGPPPREAGAATRDKVDAKAPKRTSDDNDGGASEHDLADFTAFGQETLERIFREAEQLERA